jgi:hypothetical protein
MRMLQVAVLIVLGTLSTACAPMFAPPGSRMMAPVRVSPVGRWDAVMDLRPSMLVGVLTADGVAHTGRFTRAGLVWMRLYENGAEVEFARDEVVRVDLLRGQGSGAVAGNVAKSAAAGAIALAATEAFFGLALGGKLWMPRARTWAAGAATGAVSGLGYAFAGQSERTIYVSPELVR